MSKKNNGNPRTSIRRDQLRRGYVFVTGSFVGWDLPTREEFAAAVAEYSLLEVLPILAQINVALQAGGLDDESYTTALFKWMFSPADQLQIEAVQTPFVKCIVTPMQLRYGMLALLRFGNREGGCSLQDPNALHRFGRLLLFSVDLFSPDIPIASEPGLDQFLGIALSQINAGYYRSGRLLADALLKAHLLQTLPALGVDKQIQETLGINSVDLQTVLLSLVLHFEKQDPLFLSHGLSTFLDYEGHLRGTKATAAIGQAILREATFALSDLPPRSLDPLAEPLSLKALAERPLAYFEGSLCCLDLDFLTIRASRGRWNLATATMTKRQRGVFGDRTGDLFQQYCSRLLETAAAARESAWSASKDLLEHAPADGLFVDGDYAVVFEFKSAPLPHSAVYGSDPTALGKAIDEKFVFGDGKAAYGFSQCANHLGTMLKETERFHLDSVRHIVPCIVLADDVMTMFPAYAYTVLRSEPLFEHFGPLVDRPVILHYDDLLMLVERSKYKRLSHMVYRLAKANIMTELSIRNAILDRWPIEAVFAAGLYVEIDHPRDLLDQAVARLDAGSAPLKEDCRKCGHPMKLVLGPPSLTWLCQACGDKLVIQS